MEGWMEVAHRARNAAEACAGRKDRRLSPMVEVRKEPSEGRVTTEK